MKKILTLLALIIVTLGIQSAVQGGLSFAVAGGQQIDYLGQGGSYTIDAGKSFIVKRLRPFRFDSVPGPEYVAAADERVWSTNGGAPSAKFEDWVEFGQVPENCEIDYQAIDDDVDDRINKFYIDSEEIYSMPQGMVANGGFKTGSAGSLRLHAVDSIGMWLNKCENPPTVTPTEIPPSPTVTATNTPPEPTFTPTGTLTATPQQTETPSPSETPPSKETPSPTATIGAPEPTHTPTVEPTATKKPRLPSCSRINFDIGGDSALAGQYDVMEIGGRHLYSWFAQEGWQDSGWFHGIDITFENVLVEVIYQNPDGSPITLKMLNPAPNTPYGWMSRGICHALEVSWPDSQPLTSRPGAPVQGTPPSASPSSPVFTPQVEEVVPTPEPSPSSGFSLRG